MSSGEESDSVGVISREENLQVSSGESTLKEFLSEAYHLALDDKHSVKLNDLRLDHPDYELNDLYGLPARARLRIWEYLDFIDILSVGQTCSKFRQEVLPLYEVKMLLTSPVQRFMNMLPFIPLNHYLDPATRNTLRLVCKHMKTTMDFYDDIDKRSTGSRWGSMAEASYPGYSDFDTSVGYYSQQSVMQKRCWHKVHIFDLNIQDLKRIFSKLDVISLKYVENVCGVFKRIVCELKEYPFEEYKENNFKLNLMDLPFEVHEKLLNFCNSKDRQSLRLVSKLMQLQVDTLAGVQVHLNDLKWGWNSTCGKLPPAYSLIITNVENIQAVRYFTNEDNCKLLTRVVLDGKFPAKAFIHLAESCKNLRYVGFTHALQMSSIEDEIRKSFPVKRLPLELLSLRAINLKVQEIDLPSNNIFRVHSWTWANALEFMKPGLLYVPRLTSFYLCEESIITHNLMYEVAEKVLKFVLEHRHTLKHISVILNGTCLRSCDCPHFLFQMKEDALKDLRLAKYCHDCDWRISRPFTSILCAQKSLKELSCFKLSDWEFYAGIISNNRNSLRSVKIEKNLAPVIDLNAFSLCQNLEHLWISQYGSSNLGQQSCNCMRSIRVDQRLTNLDTLPISVKSLHILDQTVDVDQIKTIPQRLTNLEILDLQFLGSWNGKSFGMSAETVAEILQLRKLDCLFLEEVRTLGMHLPHSFESFISEINLISIEYSQIINKTYGCAVHGVLVAKCLPNPEFMPDWQHRVSCYFENPVPSTHFYFDYEDYLVMLNGEEEENLTDAEEESWEGF